MSGNGAILYFCGSFPDRDSLCDLTARVFKDTSVLRAAYAALRPQVCNQLFFQRSPGLNEQATVNGLVRHAHTLVTGILSRQPSGNLFRRPVQQQFTRNDLAVAPGSQAGTASDVRPNPRLADPLHWRGIRDGHHAGPLPDSPSTRRAPEAGRSYEAMHRKPARARCPLAPRL